MLLCSACGPDISDIKRDLQSDNDEHRKRAIEFVKHMQRPDLAPLVEPLLQDENKRLRREALKALDRLENPNSLAALAEAARNSDLSTVDVLEAIFHLDDPDAIPILEEFLDHPEAKVRAAAADYIRGIEEHLNRGIVFHSIGDPVQSRLGQIIESHAAVVPELRP